MQTKEYVFHDRSAWSKAHLAVGEPDKVQWSDKETGLPCLAVRNMSGAWCGYVGVSKGHPYFEKFYDECQEIDVHGGLTFSGKCQVSEHGICHIVEKGEDEDVWWLGFDCAHAGDSLLAHDMNIYNDTYKTLAYVQAEVKSLARQLVGVVERGRK